MCGNVGVAGNLLYQDEFMMKNLLLFDYVRGEHSTGLAGIRSNGDIHLAKLGSNPIDLFNMAQFKATLNGSASRAFIGHNRQATRGAVNTANAHPFHYGDVVGAHNGTLDYKSVRALEEKLGEKFAVDSQALIASIAKFGIEETIGMCYEGKDSKDGAWALVWFDKAKNTLNFLRNKHRSLYYCYEEGFKRMMWASEWWMMRAAIEASPNSYKIYTEKDGDTNVGFFNFEPDIWYEYNLDKLVAGSNKRPKPKATPLKGKEQTVPVSTEDFFDPLPEFMRESTRGAYGTTGTTATRTSSNQRTGCTFPTRTRTSTPDSRSVIPLTGRTSVPYAGVVDLDYFEEIAFGPQKINTCSWCGEDVKYGDQGLTIYERDGRIICAPCNGKEAGSGLKNSTRIYVRPELFNQLAAL